MTRKADFNAEEWAIVIEAPMLAGMLVLGASRGGTFREMRAIARVYDEARAQSNESDLLDAIVSDRAVVQPAQRRGDREAVTDEAWSRVRRALVIIDRVATEDEANEFRRFIWHLADRTARAHKEGGILGIGGQEISDHEQAVLDQLGRLFDAPTGH